MKKILLLGDSIRKGYDKYVAMAFEGVAEVYYPKDNCRFAAYLLRNLGDWKKELGCGSDVDLIHWNAGLWDTLELQDGLPLTDLSVYQSYLPRIHGIMQMLWPDAKQIFATSTAVIEHLFLGACKRKNAVIEQYNRVAVETLTPLGVQINDLYELNRTFPESYHSDCTHMYTRCGTEPIVKQVVSYIEQALDIHAKELDYDALFATEKDTVGI